MRKAPCAAEPSCPCIYPQDVDACVNQGIVWSLEESGDGWDDVRAAVIEAKKERVKALDTIKEKYGPGVSAAAKWAKVIAGEVGGALPTEGIKLDKPTATAHLDSPRDLAVRADGGKRPPIYSKRSAAHTRFSECAAKL